MIFVFAPDEPALVRLRQYMPQIVPGNDAILRIPFEPVNGIASLAESLLAIESPSPSLRLVWIDADPALPDQLEHRREAWRKALARLNRYRNTLQSRFSCTLAIALPTRWMPDLRESAPDLWSIRSGIFDCIPTASTINVYGSFASTDHSDHVRSIWQASGDPDETILAANKLLHKPDQATLRAQLLLRAGKQYASRLEWVNAIQTLEDARKISLDTNNLGLVIEITSSLAGVCYYISKLPDAEKYSRESLRLARECFGEDHPEVAISLSNFALNLRDVNQLEEAESLLRRALAIFQGSFGDSHPKVAVALNNLGLVLNDLNKVAEAEDAFNTSVAIIEATFGPEYYSLAPGLDNLAQILREKGELANAEALMRRALGIAITAFGSREPKVAIRLNNLSLLLKETGRYAEAESFMRECIRIVENYLGGDHPFLAVSLDNLAQLLQKMEEFKEAEFLMRRALRMAETGLGPRHPNVVKFLNNLSGLLRCTRQEPEAELLLRRAKSIAEERPEFDRLTHASVLHRLAGLLRDTNRQDEAEVLMRESLQVLISYAEMAGYESKFFQAIIKDYRDLLKTMDMSQEEIKNRLRGFKLPSQE